MKTIIVLSRKGGTGKTTTVHALGAGLIKHGKKVLFMDMDGQSNLTLTFGADENQADCFDVLCNKTPISEAIQHTAQGDIVAASECLYACDKVLSGVKDMHILTKALEEVKKKYDYCIIDTPPALGMITLNCILAANKIIVPVQADLYSVQGVPRLVQTFEDIEEKTGQKRKIDGLLLTRYNPRITISKSIFEDLKDVAAKYDARVYHAAIRECAALKEAELMQQNIFDYAPKSNAAKDYTDFIIEFVS